MISVRASIGKPPWTTWPLAGPTRPSARRGVASIVLAVGLLIVAALATAPGAMAHAELVRSDPPTEGLLVAPPREIDLWFSERVDTGEGSPSVRVLDDEGQELPVANVRVDPADPKHVIAEVDGLQPGTATVVWSVRSMDDGHTLTGTFAFRVGAGRAPGAATVDGERPLPWAVITRWLTFLGAAAAAAGFAFGRVILRPGREPARAATRRTALIAGGAAGGLIATLAEPFLQHVWPPAGSVTPSWGDAVAGLPSGWWWRPAALLPCTLLALRFARRGKAIPSFIAWIGFLLGLAALLGLSLTSHAAARDDWRLPAVASNVLHQWSIALWVGGLAHLALWWSSRGTETAEPSPESDRPVRRFSRFALALVAIGVGTGVANAGLVLPTLRSLWHSDYGVVLILKVAVLTVPLALATFNRRALRRSVEALVPAVRSAVRIEAAITLAVVLGGSSLALLAPPAVEADRPIVADVPMPAFAAYEEQDLLVHLLFSPGKPGENTVRVQITNYDRSPFTGPPPELVRLQFANLAVSADPPPIDATAEPDGTWVARSLQLGLPGWWRIEVTLRWLGQDDVVVPYYLILPDPNLNGLDAPGDDPPSDPAATDAYQRAMELYTGMHRVRYTQSMASHLGTVSYGVHVVNDGADGSTPGFTFDIPGGWQYVVLGTTSWSKRPGEPWKEGKANPMIPPERWDEEYVGARGFQFGRTEVIDGEPCQILTFVVPGTQKQVVAWYAWWIGTETGRVHREAMISQSHYMVSDFSEFDAPVTIVPPVTETAEPAGSPVP